MEGGWRPRRASPTPLLHPPTSTPSLTRAACGGVVVRPFACTLHFTRPLRLVTHSTRVLHPSSLTFTLCSLVLSVDSPRHTCPSPTSSHTFTGHFHLHSHVPKVHSRVPTPVPGLQCLYTPGVDVLPLVYPNGHPDPSQGPPHVPRPRSSGTPGSRGVDGVGVTLPPTRPGNRRTNRRGVVTPVVSKWSP